jgi:hypothetical protein
MAKQTKTFNISIADLALVPGDNLFFKFQIQNPTTNNFTASFIPVASAQMTIQTQAGDTGYNSTNCSYFNTASMASSTNTITLSTGITNYYGSQYLFTPNPTANTNNSLYDIYGDTDYTFNPKPNDIVFTYLSDGTYKENTITLVSISGSSLVLTLNTDITNLYKTDLINGTYKRFLILSRVEDETNAYATFKKRDGTTSYGFIIPSNIAPSVLANIDTITKEVKLKLLADQSGITINTF